MSDREDLLAQLAEMTDQIILSLSQLEINKGTEHQLQVNLQLLYINFFSCLLTGLRLLTKKVYLYFSYYVELNERNRL
jgi:hypothetical protein